MIGNRKTLAVSIATPGGDNPLLLELRQSTPIYAGIALVAGQLSLVAKGGTAPYAFSIFSTSSNDLPPGLDIPDPVDNKKADILGTATAAGHFTFIAEVADDNSNTFPHSFSIDVLAPIAWVRFQPVPGENLLHYSYRMLARDLAGNDITSGYALDSGNLPDGCAINDNGTIDGDPTFAAIGISYATISVTHGGFTSKIPITITVYGPFLSFSIDFRQTIYAGVPFTGLVPTTFPTGGALHTYRYQWSNLAAYPWLKFDYNANTFSGTSPIENIGIEQVVSGNAFDALGATIPVELRFTPVYAQAGVEIAGSDIVFTPNTGFLAIGSSDGSVIVEPTSDGGVDLRAIGGGPSPGDGIQTINGVGPDSSGDLTFTSPDGSVDIGTDSNGDVTLQTATRGGVTLRVGREDGPIISSGFRRTWILPASYKDIKAGTWEIFVSPNATTHIDVQYRAFGATKPNTSDSIVGGTHPGVISGTDDTGAQSGWSVDSIDRGAFISIEMIDNDFAEEIVFFFPATKVS